MSKADRIATLLDTPSFDSDLSVTGDVTMLNGGLTQTFNDDTNLWTDINSGANVYTPMGNELVIQNDALDVTNSMASIFFKPGQTTSGLQMNSARIAAVREAAFDTSLVFSTRATNPGGHTEKMRITSDGNVGIGHDEPSAKLDVDGDIHDTTGDVRTPLHITLSGADDHNLTNEGVYVIDGSSTFSQIIIGDGATLTAGTIMTIYNNRSTSVTISKGSISGMRNAADGDYTDYSTLTLGRNSVTTVTMFFSGLIVLTGTDITT